MTTFDELLNWAEDLIRHDLTAVQRQITEYGSIDLEIMGMGLIEVADWDVSNADHDRIGQEMALTFYLQGKIARCVSAMAAHQESSADSLRDLRVYSLMLAHVREFGHWRIEGTPSAATD